MSTTNAGKSGYMSPSRGNVGEISSITEKFLAYKKDKNEENYQAFAEAVQNKKLKIKFTHNGINESIYLNRNNMSKLKHVAVGHLKENFANRKGSTDYANKLIFERIQNVQIIYA